MSDIDDVLDKGRADSIHRVFKDFRATLHITTPEYAYVQVGKMRYYFHSTSWAKPYKQEVETLDGKMHEQAVIPYDGWEANQ